MKNPELKACLQELQKSYYANQAKHQKKLKDHKLWESRLNRAEHEQTKGVVFGIQGCLNYVNEFLGKLE